jgi:hypothetical protein
MRKIKSGVLSMNLSPNRILTIIVGLFTTIAIVVALVLSSQTEKELSSSSPEGTVQLFLKAVFDERNDIAAQYLSSDSKCQEEDFDRAYIPESRRVRLIDSEISSGVARVKVGVEISSDGPFNSPFSERHKYRLQKNEEKWKIEGIPWPLYDCGNWKEN